MGLIFTIIVAALVIVPLWRICSRAGFNGALSLLAIIPWLGIVIIGAILSFSNWPVKAITTKEQ
jgi:uncharacterized membrane protein YhaH (DUF805 family)